MEDAEKTARDAAILAWREAKANFDRWQEYERTLRTNVARLLFPNPTKGTNRVQLGKGYSVKYAYTLTYKLGDKDMVDPATNEKIPIEKQVNSVLEEIYNLGNEGPMLADRLVKWEPKLVESEYNKLNLEFEIERQAKELIDTILTIKPAATPQLTFEEPKE